MAPILVESERTCFDEGLCCLSRLCLSTLNCDQPSVDTTEMFVSRWQNHKLTWMFSRQRNFMNPRQRLMMSRLRAMSQQLRYRSSKHAGLAFSSTQPMVAKCHSIPFFLFAFSLTTRNVRGIQNQQNSPQGCSMTKKRKQRARSTLRLVLLDHALDFCILSTP